MKALVVTITAACLSLASMQSHAALSISKVRSLAFGTFVARSGGTVAVAPEGTRSKTGGVILISIGTASAAAFLVSDNDSANASRAYNIALPEVEQITLNKGTASITVTDFVSSPAYQGRLTDGAQMLHVGASLRAPAGLPPGDYSGTFSVTVIYQ